MAARRRAVAFSVPAISRISSRNIVRWHRVLCARMHHVAAPMSLAVLWVPVVLALRAALVDPLAVDDMAIGHPKIKWHN